MRPEVDRGSPTGPGGRAPRRRAFGWALVAGGVAALAAAATLASPMLTAGAGHDTLPEPLLPPLPPAAELPDVPLPADPVDGPVDGVAFQLSVPSIGYHATVLEGTAAAQLDRSAGHYVTTAWPGQRGNVGVAGHNTYWLAFGGLKPGDRVEIAAHTGQYAYEITEIKVVDPGDRTVLAPTGDRRLTLTTCYPLWAGAWATQRLIFTATQVGGP